MAMNGAFRTLTFDGEVSTDYGVYISGSGTFNAPERDVEMITIPGRNGNFVLDNGRFENIEVTYRAGLYGVDEENFAEKIAEFRNFLCSKKGYCRLEDDYNPDEYRLAVYKSGLEVEPELLKAGEFDIVFDCKPQRYLKSGEVESSITSGSRLINPTKFESSPLLITNGYGQVNINDETLRVMNKELGDVTLSSTFSGRTFGLNSIRVPLTNTSSLNSGDQIKVPKITLVYRETYPETLTRATIQSATNCTATATVSGKTAIYTITIPELTFNNGVDATEQASIYTKVYYRDTSPEGSISFEVYYVATNNYIEIVPLGAEADTCDVTIPPIIGKSTISVLPSAIYIDLDTGEAFYYDDETPVSANSLVELPAILPTLQPSENIITFDNTMTGVKIAPRWWQV